jgi:hypothetical protein
LPHEKTLGVQHDNDEQITFPSTSPWHDNHGQCPREDDR